MHKRRERVHSTQIFSWRERKAGRVFLRHEKGIDTRGSFKISSRQLYICSFSGNQGKEEKKITRDTRKSPFLQRTLQGYLLSTLDDVILGSRGGKLD
jgi:hypothetical protein